MLLDKFLIVLQLNLFILIKLFDKSEVSVSNVYTAVNKTFS